jgi:hypothetical protein
MAAHPPCSLQLCAAALLSRMAKSDDLARAIFRAGGMGPLFALWEGGAKLTPHPPPPGAGDLPAGDAAAGLTGIPAGGSPKPAGVPEGGPRGVAPAAGGGGYG